MANRFSVLMFSELWGSRINRLSMLDLNGTLSPNTFLYPASPCICPVGGARVMSGGAYDIPVQKKFFALRTPPAAARGRPEAPGGARGRPEAPGGARGRPEAPGGARRRPEGFLGG